MPAYYYLDTRAEMLEYLRRRELPASPELWASIMAAYKSKWGREPKPTLRMVMRDLVVLKRAAFLFSEPCYLFGDDVADYFNHFAISPEDLWKVGIAFLGSEGDVSDAAPRRGANGEYLVFVSEQRMGFGLSPNSKIAQDFSEALNFMLRQDVDAIEDPILLAEPTP